MKIISNKKRLLTVLVSVLVMAGIYASFISHSRKTNIPSATIAEGDRKISREILDKAVELGKEYLLNSQRPHGNFNYLYNFITDKIDEDDNQVRQAGPLWGFALLYNDSPSEEVKEALLKGLDYFDGISIETLDGRKYIVYPGSIMGETGTVALITLALIDYLRTEGNSDPGQNLKRDLDKYIKFLISVRTPNGQFHKSYDYQTGMGLSDPSPYYDGEVLLALTKAAKYLGYSGLRDITLSTAEEMYKVNVEKALERDPDSPVTKGFYQWSSMAYYEIYTSGWDNTDKYAARVIDLAYWMIDVHKTLEMPANTAYAYEGLIHAWELARLTGNAAAMDKISEVIETGLKKLISWQIGSPFENEYIRSNKKTDSKARGGVMNSASNPDLRIDVTQHQTHAAILARRYIHKSE